MPEFDTVPVSVADVAQGSVGPQEHDVADMLHALATGGATGAGRAYRNAALWLLRRTRNSVETAPRAGGDRLEEGVAFQLGVALACRWMLSLEPKAQDRLRQG